MRAVVAGELAERHLSRQRPLSRSSRISSSCVGSKQLLGQITVRVRFWGRRRHRVENVAIDKRQRMLLHLLVLDGFCQQGTFGLV